MATAARERVDASIAYRLNIGELLARLATDERRGLSDRRRTRESSSTDTTSSRPRNPFRHGGDSSRGSRMCS